MSNYRQKKISLMHTRATWDIIEQMAKKRGSKNFRLYLTKEVYNKTLPISIEGIDRCLCDKTHNAFFFEEDVYAKIIAVSNILCIPVASVINQLFIYPLIIEHYETNGFTQK